MKIDTGLAPTEYYAANKIWCILALYNFYSRGSLWWILWILLNSTSYKKLREHISSKVFDKKLYDYIKQSGQKILFNLRYAFLQLNKLEIVWLLPE